MEGGPPPAAEEAVVLDKRAIRAVVRVRPLKPDEDAYIITEPRRGRKLQLHSEKNENYSNIFSMVLGPESSQYEVFRAVGLPMAEATLRGQNACLFAYGQSGAGKTFSMYGAEGGKVPSKLDGVVPQICAELFRRKQDVEKRGDFRLQLEISLVEVKGSVVSDLLAKPVLFEGNQIQPPLKLRGSEVINAEWDQIYSSRMLTQTIERAMLRRTTGKNYFNNSSSRSHCFLTMKVSKVPVRQAAFPGRRKVESQPVEGEGEEAKAAPVSRPTESATITLIDLAGAEQFGADGLEAKMEGKAIQEGLLALGKVLEALKCGKTHVPFRDSTTTLLIRDALEGDCLTMVLACVNPGAAQYSETRNVLDFVVRASTIPLKREVADGNEADDWEDMLNGRGYDPMENDEFDPNEALNRRTEFIETASFESLHCRCSGDPEHPLLLYLHTPRLPDPTEPPPTPPSPIAAAAAAPPTFTTGGPRRPAPLVSKRPPSRIAGRAEKEKARAPRPPRLASSLAWNGVVVSAADQIVRLERVVEEKRKKGERASACARRPSPAATPRLVTPRRGSSAVKDKSFDALAAEEAEKKRRAAEARALAELKKEEQKQAKLARLIDLRVEVGSIIRSRSQELRQFKKCDLCAAPLLQLLRLKPCGHALCEACSEKHMRYFSYCPRCGTETIGDEPPDKQAAELVHLRLSTLKATPASILNEKQRYDGYVVAREKKNVFAFEFGSRPEGSSGNAIFVYLQLIRKDIGSQAQMHLPPQPIHHVTMTTNPKHFTPSEGEPGYISGWPEDECKIGFPDGSKGCHITIHWAPLLWMAPLQIQYAPPTSKSKLLCRRRVIVHFPAGSNFGGGGDKKFKEKLERVEGGEPLIFACEGNNAPEGGSVLYVPGMNAGRAQASIVPHHLSKGQGPPPKDAMSDAANKWMERLIDDTSALISDVMGDVKEVQAAVMLGASSNWPLAEVPKRVAPNRHGREAGTEKRPPRNEPMKLLEAVCSGNLPTLAAHYAELREILRDPSMRFTAAESAEKGKKRVRSDLDRPPNFFQVAIDLPGCGKSPPLEESDVDGTFNLQLLQEVICSLGKDFAYAIIVDGPGVDTLLPMLMQDPKLASFVALREPICEAMEPEQLHRILHPIFIPYEQQGPHALVASGRKLVESLPENDSIKVSLARTPDFYDNGFGTELVNFFAAHNWRGMMAGWGQPRLALPLLTRLEGGFRAWSSDKKRAAETPHEEEAKDKGKGAKEVPGYLRLTAACDGKADRSAPGERHEKLVRKSSAAESGVPDSARPHIVKQSSDGPSTHRSGPQAVKQTSEGQSTYRSGKQTSDGQTTCRSELAPALRNLHRQSSNLVEQLPRGLQRQATNLAVQFSSFMDSMSRVFQGEKSEAPPAQAPAVAKLEEQTPPVAKPEELPAQTPQAAPEAVQPAENSPQKARPLGKAAGLCQGQAARLFQIQDARIC
ncbi:hypothetical protein AB1Y20_002352 [Prymnesium parvum]|uniref:Kinesin-like protein n=1 Tax=Prymnesium parvum TaxID=97485 RepID=A0AB34JAN8_PRYPA